MFYLTHVIRWREKKFACCVKQRPSRIRQKFLLTLCKPLISSLCKERRGDRFSKTFCNLFSEGATGLFGLYVLQLPFCMGIGQVMETLEKMLTKYFLHADVILSSRNWATEGIIRSRVVVVVPDVDWMMGETAGSRHD